MSNSTELLVLAFPEEGTAQKAMQALQHLVEEGQVSLRNAAVLVKNKEGRISAKEMGDIGLKQGALFGAIVGGLIGLVGGPVGAVVGAVAGATTGGVAAHAIDLGFPDDYLTDLQASLQPGSSALIVLAEKLWIDKIIQGLAQFDGHIIRHVLKEDLAAHLAAVGVIQNDTADAAMLPAQLEEQIATWQVELERLKLKEKDSGGRTPKEIRDQMVNLRTKLRRTQEKLHRLWNTEIQACTEKIKTLQLKAETAPATSQAEILAELEDTRAYRREIRDKLYRQIEANLTGLQAEIDELKARVIEIKPANTGPVDSRIAALKRFVGPMDEPTLPTGETEAAERLAVLQARVAAAEAELETQRELQIEAWQEASKDLQAYAEIPGVIDKAAVEERIRVLQDQLAAAKATLKTQLETQVAAWDAEIKQLQAQLATVGAAERAKTNEQIAALRAQIEMLQIKAETAGAAERINLNTRIAILQDKVAKAQAKLKALN
ncbi:MAG: DUF1269 domain-containing protein [Anaerolineae bacterium]|nr:DUF1269 domain-containing protein [Anaerolineae bacterium]